MSQLEVKSSYSNFREFKLIWRLCSLKKQISFQVLIGKQSRGLARALPGPVDMDEQEDLVCLFACFAYFNVLEEFMLDHYQFLHRWVGGKGRGGLILLTCFRTHQQCSRSTFRGSLRATATFSWRLEMAGRVMPF